jgi:hypothetical protein
MIGKAGGQKIVYGTWQSILQIIDIDTGVEQQLGAARCFLGY